jgi:hypothetical protein
MKASQYGHHDIVRTLLEAEADVNAKDNVRNKMIDDHDNNNSINYLDVDDDDDCCY